MIYKINTVVKSVEFVERTVRGRMVATPSGQSEAVFDKEPLGWYVLFEGSWEKVYLGHEKPTLTKGQKVEIIIKGV